MQCACRKNIFLFLFILLIISSSCSLDEKTKHKQESFFSIGLSCYLKKDFSAAITQFQETLKIDPTHLPASIMLGKAFYYSGQPADSIRVFSKLLKKKPYSVTALVWLARIEGIDQGNKNKGLRHCQRALEIDPENYLANLYRGILAEESGMVKEAILSYSSAIDLENVIYLAHFKLGRLYQEKGLFDKALIEFKKMLRYDLGKELESDVLKRIKLNESK